MSKRCFKCGESKQLSEFYRHKMMADGHLNKCKECTKADSRRHRNENLEAIRKYDVARARLPHRREKSMAATANRRATAPRAVAATRKVQYEIRAGRMKRRCCEVCGAKYTHAHHDDYMKPAEVRWLCPVHHFEWHQRHGEGANKYA